MQVRDVHMSSNSEETKDCGNCKDKDSPKHLMPCKYCNRNETHSDRWREYYYVCTG